MGQTEPHEVGELCPQHAEIKARPTAGGKTTDGIKGLDDLFGSDDDSR